jgi:hypothetical protein
VILTAFGASRLAYIGYVSPTQLNVLLLSDTNSTTVQVQVKNAAGVMPQTSLLVQSNVPQMLTADGSHVAAGHADGSPVSNVLPGSGGAYQINVQIPANAANEDLPVVAQLGGGTNSASVLIPVQK